MATIDKSLPNTKTEIEIPGEDVILEEQQEIIERQKGKEPEIEMQEDGGAPLILIQDKLIQKADKTILKI